MVFFFPCFKLSLSKLSTGVLAFREPVIHAVDHSYPRLERLSAYIDVVLIKKHFVCVLNSDILCLGSRHFTSLSFKSFRNVMKEKFFFSLLGERV